MSKNLEKGKDSVTEETELVTMVFRMDCCDTTKLGEYANMWYVSAASSVLGQPITSDYPQQNPLLRHSMNKNVLPRHTTQLHGLNRRFVVLWTHTGEMPKGNNWWSPNHFVPCVDKRTPQCVISFHSCSDEGKNLQSPHYHPILIS